MEKIKKKTKELQLEILEKLSTLITAGLGLVAALAWNSFIQNLFKEIFGTYSSLWAQGAYALLITVVVVVATIYIGRAVNRLKAELKEEEKNSPQGEKR